MFRKFSNILLLHGLILTSCSSLAVKQIDSPMEFNQAHLNQEIRLVMVKGLSAFKTNQDVAVLLEYDTVNEVIFPSDYNLRIFIQHDGGWIEIKEKPTIRPNDPVILSPKIPSSHGQLVGFWPQLPDIKKTYNLRVYIFGDMKTKEGTEQVAAYTDIILTP